MRKTASKPYAILQRYPEPVLNNTTVNHLGNTGEPIEVFPPEIFFKDIEPNQNYEVTVTVRNISKRVRRLKFTSPKTSKFQIEHDMSGPVAAGLAVKMNVAFETDADGDFHDVIDIQCEGHDQKFQLFLHALKPAADIQFEPLVNFRFIPIKSSKTEEIEFKNEGRMTGTVMLQVDELKGAGLEVTPTQFSIEPDEIKRVSVTLTATEPDLITRLLHVAIDGQDKSRTIEVTATSVEQHLSIVFEEGGGQKSSLNFGTLYMGERREYPAFLVNNGPQPAAYNLRFLNGLKNLDENYQETPEQFISPAQAGKELTDRVLTAEPLQGTVGPYSQIPVTFICRTKKFEKIGGFTDNNPRSMKASSSAGSRAGSAATMGLDEKFVIKPEDYATLALVNFGNIEHEDLKVQMMARACYPDLKISKQQLQFGECASNERKDFVLTVTNRNEDLSLDFNFSKAASFKALPCKGKLLPGTEHSITISFEPKNLGNITQEMHLDVLGGVYRRTLKLSGHCNKVGKRENGVRGPMARPQDFEPARNFINEYQAEARTLQSKIDGDQTVQQAPPQMNNLQQQIDQMIESKENKNIIERFNDNEKAFQGQENNHTMVQSNSQSAFEKSHGVQAALKAGNSVAVEKYAKILANKHNANDFIKNERLARDRDVRIQHQLKHTNRMPPESLEDMEKDPDLGMSGNMPGPKLMVPSQVDPLYVEKPLGKYEPSQDGLARLRKKKDETDQDRIIKRKWKAEPQTQAEVRDCSVELSGEQLQKINAGPQQVNFKSVFVKSTTAKSFIVSNDLRQHVYVRLLVDQFPELAQSSPLSQVIPPGQEAGFDILFCSQTTKTFSAPITYYINDRPFSFLVQAQANPVVLDVSKNVLKFEFNDDNMDMSVTEKLVISNHGNASAKFTWKFGENSSFVPEPKFDEVPAGGHKTVVVTFRPSGTKSVEEGLILQIEDGQHQEVKCVGMINESACIFKEKMLEFGNIPVGLKSRDSILTMKNQKRTTAIFHIECDNEELTISPMRGRIGGDSSQILTIGFISQIAMDFNANIKVYIRGGKAMQMNVHACAIIPEIQIFEKELDFGGLTVGDSKTLPLTVYNHSDIAAKLILDIREYPEFEIIVPPPSKDDDVVSEIMVPIQEEATPQADLDDMNPDDLQDPLADDDMMEDEEEDEEELNRHVQLSLRPERSPLKLQLKYTPKDVDDPRDFVLPLSLAGVGKMAVLDRVVKGVGVKPRFLIEPTVVNFKTKVIAKGSKPLPFHEDITIRNPDHNPITWSIDRDILDDSKVFQMNPTDGRLEPGATSTVRVTFNPLEPIQYVCTAPLFLDGEKEKPYLMVEFRGEGADAKIFFDRREIILPCTPLDTPARATFTVCHNGYENLELRPKIANEVGQLPIELFYPDGQNLGVTKTRLKVEAVFTSPKPLSFTTFIDFYDDEGNKFPIPISGTTDNSVFTVFSFMQRHPEEISIEAEPGKPIRLIQDASSDVDAGPAGTVKAFTKTAGASSIQSFRPQSLLGFSPVPLAALEKNCEYVCRWYNATMQSSSLQYFPVDVINQSGQHVYDLVQYLSGKKAPGQVAKSALVAKANNAKEYLDLLIRQYEELINFLKVNGAHLNTVRPEYLLGLSDYNKFLKLNPKEENMKPKTLEKVLPYLGMEAWLTIFYQVLKIYYLNRVTPKSFKNLPGLPPTETGVEPNMTKSNIYSVPETILLKWLTFHYCKVNPMHPKTITNFDADLQDGLVFAALIKSHYGNAAALAGLKASVQYEEQVLFNAKLVIEAVHEIGLQTHLSPKDIVAPSARELLLFCVQLYQGLPHYIAKAQIEFPAVLGDLVTKNIELSNPSKNPICYWVKLDGCPDFAIESEQVRIEPGQSHNFPIKFQSRISKVVTGKVIFTNKKEGNVQAAAMVFELVSNVYERNSVDNINKSTKLYKPSQIDIDLHNPFPQDVIFGVQIVYEKAVKAGGKGKKDARGQPAAKDKAVADSKAAKEKASLLGVPGPYTCPLPVVKVRKNQTVNVPLQFLPFELGVHKCHVVFTDEAVGELQYTIIGKAELPEILDTFQADCNSEEAYSFKKLLNYKNDKLEQAKNQIMDKAAQARQKELQAQQLADAKNGKAVAVESKYFEIEISNPFFSGPSSVTLQDASKAGGQGKTTDRGKKGEVTREQSSVDIGASNTLELNCNPAKPASYTCYVILKSQDRTDIRLYEYKLTAIPQKIKAQLEFRVPARGQVTQEIPIVNNSSQEWKVVATLEQSKGGAFSMLRPAVTVKKQAQENFQLTFKPQWVSQTTGLLTLKNESTKEEYEYELKGIGEEPLAEDHIVLQCKARETTHHTFEIKNQTDKAQVYTVWTDLQNAVGTKEITVKSRASYNYELAITPLLGGVYTASITFQDAEERFLWWTVEVRTDSPKPEAVIDLKAFIRQATSAEISLSNPLNEPITFEVFYNGEGLIGDSAFGLEPNNIGTYNLIFSPLAAGAAQGTIGFLNEKVGEFWYDLNLHAEENPAINLELLECELGKIASHSVTLENPTGQELYLEFRNSNPTNFEIVPDKIILPAYETLKVGIQYSPTNLDAVESGNIVFENPIVGKWQYNVEGKGLLPTIMEPQPISTEVGGNTSSMLTFKNPFKEASTVQVHLETDDTKIFSLLLKRNKFNIGALGILQIPYSFAPETMTESTAIIVVSMSKQLVWKYPLRGIAESASTSIDYHFKTRARRPHDEQIRIVLPGFQDASSADTFTYELNVLNAQHKGLVDRSVFFEQKSERIMSADDPLEFAMRFEPLRPYKTNIEFMIYKSSGGRWKFNMVFEALEPEVDDVITIQSPLHKTSSVSFKLNNHLKSYAQFQAFFTPDSAAEFAVHPKAGELEPYGKDGTNFIVSFTPTEYGKAKVGKMVIQTEEMQWTYEIRGSHPHYKIPEVGTGRIANKLSANVVKQMKQKQLTKKNFLKHNLRTAQYNKSPNRKDGQQSMTNLSYRAGNSTVGGGRGKGDLSKERSTM